MNYCPKCGFEVKGMKFCPKCGFKIKSPEGEEVNNFSVRIHQEQDESTIEKEVSVNYADIESLDPQVNPNGQDETRRLRTALVGEKADHYIPIFEDLDKNGGQSWNWCGCLFSPFWFAYRKLYGWAAIAIAVPLILGIIMGLMLLSYQVNSDALLNGASRLIGIVCAIVFGIVSNKAYKKRIDKLIVEMPTNLDAQERYINSKGGVSGGGLVLALIITIALNVGLTMI